jgi:hypothetical protein
MKTIYIKPANEDVIPFLNGFWYVKSLVSSIIVVDFLKLVTTYHTFWLDVKQLKNLFL